MVDLMDSRWMEYGLTTANILYRMPDHPSILQTFLWQTYDVPPEFPEVHRFLDFWKREIEGPIHSVTIAHKRLIRVGEFRPVETQLILH